MKYIVEKNEYKNSNLNEMINEYMNRNYSKFRLFIKKYKKKKYNRNLN